MKKQLHNIVRMLITYVVAFMICALITLFSSCKTTERTTYHQTDSVRVETLEVTKLVPDTVFITIPSQTAERTTADSTSTLENDYAISHAKINEDGSLYHDLATKPQQKPVEVQTKEKTKTIYKDRNLTISKTVEKEKPLTLWQKFCINGFIWVILLLLIETLFLLIVYKNRGKN